MNQPLLSIIIPTYNRPLLLENCLNHVYGMKERGLDCEVIIVDSSEEDHTKKLAEKFGAKYVWFEAGDDLDRVSWKIYVGLNEASGVYSAYLGDDDYFIEGNLKEALGFLQNNTQIIGYYASWDGWNDITKAIRRQVSRWFNQPTLFSRLNKEELLQWMKFSYFLAEIWIAKTEEIRLIYMAHSLKKNDNVPILGREIIGLFKLLSFGDIYITYIPFYRSVDVIQPSLVPENVEYSRMGGKLVTQYGYAETFGATYDYIEAQLKGKNENSDTERMLQDAIKLIHEQFAILESYKEIIIFGFQQPENIENIFKELDDTITIMDFESESQLSKTAQILTPTVKHKQSLLKIFPHLNWAQVIALEDVMNLLKVFPEDVDCSGF